MLPPPPAWTRAGRYALAVVAGAAGWIAHAADRASGPLPPGDEDLVGALLVLDLLLGVAMLAVLPLRHRHPLAVACGLVAGLAFAAAGVGAAAIAVAAMATHRRRGWAVAVVAVAAAGGTAAELVYPGFSAGTVAVTLVFVVACLATGAYLGTRRDLVAAVYERALTAEREQVLAAGAARDAERTRIAREMHDVLAHRISLVALHAGALTYRDDLTRAETAGTAGIIQANAQLALTELREVLGVLRTAGDATGSDTEPPQPTLAELPALLADAREAGTQVRLDSSVAAREVPETVSRTAFRIVQEALTNARRHAPGAPVTVRLATGPGGQLDVEVGNPAPAGAAALPAPAVPLVPAAPRGMGLVGLAERAELAGGTFSAGPEPGTGAFVVRARLPWTA